MGTNRLRKNSAGRRCDQKALREALSVRNPTANTALGRVLRSSSFPSAIRVNPRPSAVKLDG